MTYESKLCSIIQYSFSEKRNDRCEYCCLISFTNILGLKIQWKLRHQKKIGQLSKRPLTTMTDNATCWSTNNRKWRSIDSCSWPVDDRWWKPTNTYQRWWTIDIYSWWSTFVAWWKKNHLLIRLWSFFSILFNFFFSLIFTWYLFSSTFLYFLGHATPWWMFSTFWWLNTKRIGDLQRNLHYLFRSVICINLNFDLELFDRSTAEEATTVESQ